MKSAVKLDPKKRGLEAEKLYQGLTERVVGQEEAVREIVDAYQLCRSGLHAPGRPISTMLFLGPTGCGKTRLVESAAECLVGTSKAVIKIDCGEFQHSHEIAKLIGSPPGYLGHRETHALLSQDAIDQYHTEDVKVSFVLFDEIEKASDSLWNLLLGVLDKGVLTLGDNRKVDFSRTMIFMTGNLGAAEMTAMLQPKMGFEAFGHNPNVIAEAVGEKMGRTVVDAARRKFTPEFINRLDKIVVFHPLGHDELRKIVDIEIGSVEGRIARQPIDRRFEFSVTSSGKEYLLEQGTDVRYGARHLKRAIDRLLVQPLASLMASEQVRGGDAISVDHKGNLPTLSFLRIGERVAYEAQAA